MEEIKTIDSITCKEIYVILNKLGFINKLPANLNEYICNNKSDSYIFDFDENIPLIYQLSNKNTENLLVYLYLKYINDSKEEKEILLNKIEANEREYQKKIQEKFNPDNLFKNNKIRTENIINKEEALVEVKEQKWYQKILTFFRRKFNINK